MKDECQKMVTGMTEVKRENMLDFLAKQNNEWKTGRFESQRELKIDKCIKLFQIVSSKLSFPQRLLLFSTTQLTKLMN